MNELWLSLSDSVKFAFDHVNDNLLSAMIGACVTFAALAIQTRLANKDQEKNQYENFFFRDETDYRRILSWIIKEVEDLSTNHFDPKNSNQRKSVAEYFLLLSSQYFRYKQARKEHPSRKLENNYLIWEKNISKNLDFVFFRESWDYCKHKLHLEGGEFASVLDSLSKQEAEKDARPQVFENNSDHLTP